METKRGNRVIKLTLRRIGSFIKCLVIGHVWEKDRSGFDPIRGCYFRSWTSKRCHTIETRREELP